VSGRTVATGDIEALGWRPDNQLEVALEQGVKPALVATFKPDGRPLGGFRVPLCGWGWIFFLTEPVGLITLALALRVIPDLGLGRRHRLDLAGVALVTAGLFGVVFGLIEGQRYNWGAVWGAVTIPEIIGLSIFQGFINAFDMPARQAFVIEMV